MRLLLIIIFIRWSLQWIFQCHIFNIWILFSCSCSWWFLEQSRRLYWLVCLGIQLRFILLFFDVFIDCWDWNCRFYSYFGSLLLLLLGKLGLTKLQLGRLPYWRITIWIVKWHYFLFNWLAMMYWLRPLRFWCHLLCWL